MWARLQGKEGKKGNQRKRPGIVSWVVGFLVKSGAVHDRCQQQPLCWIAFDERRVVSAAAVRRIQ